MYFGSILIKSTSGCLLTYFILFLIYIFCCCIYLGVQNSFFTFVLLTLIVFLLWKFDLNLIKFIVPTNVAVFRSNYFPRLYGYCIHVQGIVKENEEPRLFNVFIISIIILSLDIYFIHQLLLHIWNVCLVQRTKSLLEVNSHLI